MPQKSVDICDGGGFSSDYDTPSSRPTGFASFRRLYGRNICVVRVLLTDRFWTGLGGGRGTEGRLIPGLLRLAPKNVFVTALFLTGREADTSDCKR